MISTIQNLPINDHKDADWCYIGNNNVLFVSSENNNINSVLFDIDNHTESSLDIIFDINDTITGWDRTTQGNPEPKNLRCLCYDENNVFVVWEHNNCIFYTKISIDTSTSSSFLLLEDYSDLIITQGTNTNARAYAINNTSNLGISFNVFISQSNISFSLKQIHTNNPSKETCEIIKIPNSTNYYEYIEGIPARIIDTNGNNIQNLSGTFTTNFQPFSNNTGIEYLRPVGNTNVIEYKYFSENEAFLNSMDTSFEISSEHISNSTNISKHFFGLDDKHFIYLNGQSVVMARHLNPSVVDISPRPDYIELDGITHHKAFDRGRENILQIDDDTMLFVFLDGRFYLKIIKRV